MARARQQPKGVFWNDENSCILLLMSEHICQKLLVWYGLNWFMSILTYKILCNLCDVCFTKSKKHTFFFFGEETRLFYFRHWMPGPTPAQIQTPGRQWILLWVDLRTERYSIMQDISGES